MRKEIRIEEEKKIDITTKIIRPRQLSKEETQKRIAAEKIRLDRRGENSGLIPEVSEWLKKEYADDIIAFHKTSRARESWERLHHDYRRGENLPKDDRKTFDGDWWKTDALIANANKITKAEERYRRKEKIKDFFCVISGRKYLSKCKAKKAAKSEMKSIVKDFMNYVPLGDYVRNDREPLSVNLWNFINYIISYKQWCLLISGAEVYKILSKFKKECKNPESVLEHSEITKALLTELYHYYMKK
jgi:hypothetical protein